jgi:hypothetical protein
MPTASCRVNMKRTASTIRGPLLLGAALASLLFATACGSGKDPHLSSPAAPRELTAKPAGGSAGIGPLTPSSDGSTERAQRVALKDRVLIVNGVTKRTRVGQNTFVDVDLTLQSRRSTAIANKASSYVIMGAEGDAFAKQDNRSGAFYGTIDSYKSRTGTISFEIPAAATSSLRLLYRPSAAARTVIIPLTIR